MVIHTDSERVRLNRKMVLELLASSVDLSTTPDFELYIERYEARPERYGPPAPPDPGRERRRAGHHVVPDGQTAATVAGPVKLDNELYVRDYSKCVLCYKCVDACGDQHQNTFAITVAGRGFDAHISTEFAAPLPDSACVYCGNCIEVCPTGALMPQTEYAAARARRMGSVAPDDDRHDLRVLRCRLQPHAARSGQPDRQGQLARRPRCDARQSVREGPVRVRARALACRLTRRLSAVGNLPRSRSDKFVQRASGWAIRVPPRVNGESQVVEARSLVDSAEQALRNWLAGGRYRQGDRLPPEHEVAAMLGVSRGTLRSALQRLDESGEIVRRQGSGTFVGRMAVPSALDERLERLEPYSSLAARRGLTLTCHDLSHRPSRSRRRGGGGARTLADRTGDDDLAHPGRRRLAGRGHVRRRASQRVAARRRGAARIAGGRADGARRADRARRACHVRAHARDSVPARFPRACRQAARRASHDGRPATGGADLRGPR